MPTLQRARSADDKAARRSSMLAAAREVARASGVRQVTLTAIAARTGLHKSAVLRYFANREALLLELCQQEWEAWAGELARISREEWALAAPGAASVISESLEQRPLFCDLLAQTPAVLEREAPVDVVRSFKIQVLDAVDTAAAAVQTLFGGLSREQAIELVGVTTILAGTLWHVANPPPALRAVYEADPRLGAACIDFKPELAALLSTFLAGTSSQPSVRSPSM